MPFDSTPQHRDDGGNEFHFRLNYAVLSGWSVYMACDEFVLGFTTAADLPAGTVLIVKIAPDGAASVSYAVGTAAIVTTATVEWRR